jgi:hypothetical protein
MKTIATLTPAAATANDSAFLDILIVASSRKVCT